jgi:hypothetical protein
VAKTLKVASGELGIIVQLQRGEGSTRSHSGEIVRV